MKLNKNKMATVALAAVAVIGASQGFALADGTDLVAEAATLKTAGIAVGGAALGIFAAKQLYRVVKGFFSAAR